MVEITKEMLKRLNETKFGSLVVFNDLNKEELETTGKTDIQDIAEINFSGLEDDITLEDMQELNAIFSEIGIKRIQARNVSSKVDIGLFSQIENLDFLLIDVSKEDPAIDISRISELKQVKIISIDNMEIDDKEFENFKGLENLIGIACDSPNISKQTIEMLMSLPNIECIKVRKKVNMLDDGLPENTIAEVDWQLQNPTVTNIQQLKKIFETEYYHNQDEITIFYTSSEMIPPELFEKIDNMKIELILSTPLALGDDFCTNEKINNNPNLTFSVCNDNYEDYNLPVIFMINTKLKEIIANAPQNGTDLEKATYLYSVIGKTLEYDFCGCKEIDDVPNPNYDELKGQTTRSLYGLLDNQSVCYGYAFIYKILADQLGLECNLLLGYVCREGKEPAESEPPNHAWNQVKIDGKWYNLDVTWDSDNLKDGKDTEFFLVSDEKLYESDKNSIRKNVKKEAFSEDFVDKETGEILADDDYLYIFRNSKISEYIKQKYEMCEKCSENYPESELKQAIEPYKEKKSNPIIKGIKDLSSYIKTSELSKKVREITEKVKETLSQLQENSR